MPTLTGIGIAITIDVLLRVSFVLTAGLLLALSARRNAALRHAILVAGLAGAFIMPAAMLTVQVLPVSRWQLGLLGGRARRSGRGRRDRFATTERTASPAPRASATRPPRSLPREETRPDRIPRDDASARFGRIVPRASRNERVEFARRTMDSRRPALGVAVRDDRQGDRARSLAGAPATDRGAGASRHRRSRPVPTRADSTANPDAAPAAIVGERGRLRSRRGGRRRQLCAPADGMGRAFAIRRSAGGPLPRVRAPRATRPSRGDPPGAPRERSLVPPAGASVQPHAESRA